MYWKELPNGTSTIEKIRYFINQDNNISDEEFKDAFLNLSQEYAMEFSNLLLLEQIITEEYGANSIQAILNTTSEAEELARIDINNGDTDDIRKITLNLLDYIERKWFK